MKERIKALCKKKGVSMNTAEKEMGLAKGYLSKLDNSNPNAKTVDKMAEYFGVSYDIIVYGEESKFSKDRALLEIQITDDEELMLRLKKYIDLPQEKKELILKMIDNL